MAAVDTTVDAATTVAEATQDAGLTRADLDTVGHTPTPAVQAVAIAEARPVATQAASVAEQSAASMAVVDSTAVVVADSTAAAVVTANPAGRAV